MNLSVHPVDISHVHQVWPMVKGFIDQSQTKGIPNGALNYTTDQILTYITAGLWHLIVAADENGKIHGACVISLINYPLYRIAFITAMGGKLITGDDTFKQLEAIAKYHGATKIQALARPTMCKLMEKYGFYPGNTLMEYTI